MAKAIKGELDSLLKEQFKRDTEAASVHVPASRPVLLRAQISNAMKSAIDRYNHSVIELHRLRRLPITLSIAIFVLGLILLTAFGQPFAPGDAPSLGFAKILMLVVVLVLWLVDRND